MQRIGVGLDSHRIVKKDIQTSKNLILGGILVSKEYFAIADSDGDVILHSLCNALSTAIGGGSLDTWAGEMFRSGIADSKLFVDHIYKRVTKLGYKIGNVAIMCEGKTPRLESFRNAMQTNIAQLLGISKTAVGIAFTTGQDLTVFGKGEGIQVFSTVLLYQ